MENVIENEPLVWRPEVPKDPVTSWMALPVHVQVTVPPTPTGALRGEKKLSPTLTEAERGPAGVVGVGAGGGSVGVGVGGGWVAGGLVGVGGGGVGVAVEAAVVGVGVGEAGTVVGDAEGVAGEGDGLAVDVDGVALVAATDGVVLVAAAESDAVAVDSELLLPPQEPRRDAATRAAARTSVSRFTTPPSPDKSTGWRSSIGGGPPSVGEIASTRGLRAAGRYDDGG